MPINSFDFNSVLTLLEHCQHPRTVLDTLLQASRELRLPVQIDRRLRELTNSELEPQEVVKQLIAHVRALLR